MNTKFEHLRFGEKKSIYYPLGFEDVPANIITSILDGYENLKTTAADNTPEVFGVNPVDLLPNLTPESLKAIVGSISPTLRADYRVTGSCNDIPSIQVENVFKKLLSVSSFGITIMDVGLVISAEAEIIPGDPKVINCHPFTDRIENFLEAVKAWRESEGEGTRPSLKMFGLDNLELLNEEVVDGMKTRSFEINWFLNVTIANFNYRAEITRQTQVVSSICCT